jgi:RNA polymerase sigma-70 factor (ECF subfamily)
VNDGLTSVSLLDRVRRQDPEAWDRLLYVYGPLVEHWCRGWGLQGADAEDVRQEVFQAVSKSLATFRRDRPGDTFRGWLRVISRRKFLDLCRNRRNRPEAEGGSDAQMAMMQLPLPVESAENEATEDSPELVKGMHHRALELVRAEFEDRTWQAFWRSAVEGQAPADIARDMNISPAGVRKAKSRVLRRLKEEFGDVLG